MNECNLSGSVHLSRRATATIEVPVDLAVEVFHALKIQEMRNGSHQQEGTCSHNKKPTLSESIMMLISENYTAKTNETGWMKDMIERGTEENKRLHEAVKKTEEKYWASERMVNQLGRKIDELTPKDKEPSPETTQREN